MSKTSHLKMRDRLDQELEHFLKDEQSLFDDPIHCVSRDLNPGDAEIVSFIVAGLSYGRVEQIKKSSHALLKRLEKLGLAADGSGISRYLKNTKREVLVEELGGALNGWKHRLNTSSDIVELFCVLQKIVTESNSLCAHFQKTHTPNNTAQSLICFADNFLNPAAKVKSKSKKWSGTGVGWFAPSPKDKGTCKRLMMWLRWMVRSDGFDLGLWQNPELLDLRYPILKASHLYVPVDTHIQKWALKEKITRHKSPSWKMVVEVSDYFKKINSDDPLKYDFLICHQGMKTFRS